MQEAEHYNKTLVVGPSWVGDMVMAQSLFNRIKQQSPHQHLAVLAPAWTHPILGRMPEVDTTWAMPVGHNELGLLKRFQLARTLRKQKYDNAVVLPNSLKSALVPWLAGIPIRTGFIGEARYGLLNDVRKLNKSKLKLNVERYLALAEPKRAMQVSAIPRPKLITNQSMQYRLMTRLGLNNDGRILALCPGAEFGTAKQWPIEHFAAVANAQIKEGWQVWIFGSTKDYPISDAINRLTNNRCTVLSGQTSLVEVIDLLALCETVVSNDSGLMHVAAAVGTKVIALYGSTTPEFTPPLADNCELLSLELECSPCFSRECPLSHMDCLKKLKPEYVTERIS